MEIAELYVLANVDEEGNIESYPKGGGSSTRAQIRAYDSLSGARRGRNYTGGSIIRITGAEVVE